MPTLKTDKGITYNSLDASISFDGSFITYIWDERPLSVIASEFEGVNSLEYKDYEDKTTVFEGYSVLSAVVRDYRVNQVQVSLRKPVGGD